MELVLWNDYDKRYLQYLIDCFDVTYFFDGAGAPVITLPEDWKVSIRPGELTCYNKQHDIVFQIPMTEVYSFYTD